MEPVSKKLKTNCYNSDLSETFTQNTQLNKALIEEEIAKQIPPQDKSPILENKERSFRKCMKNGSYSIMKRLSKFTQTVLDDNVVESKFFSSPSSMDLDSSVNDSSRNSITIEESPEKVSRNPFKVKTVSEINKALFERNIDSQSTELLDSQLEISQKENCRSPVKSPSPILETSLRIKNPLSPRDNKAFGEVLSQESVIENTYPLELLVTPVDSQVCFNRVHSITAHCVAIRAVIA